jgi:hypothetical protein
LLNKIYAVAVLLAVVLAIAGAFAEIPYLAVILLVLGGLTGLGVAKEDQIRLFLVALLLTLASKSLEAIPQVGGYLSSIFGSLGVVAVGASVVAIAVSTVARIKGDWVKSPA